MNCKTIFSFFKFLQSPLSFYISVFFFSRADVIIISVIMLTVKYHAWSTTFWEEITESAWPSVFLTVFSRYNRALRSPHQALKSPVACQRPGRTVEPLPVPEMIQLPVSWTFQFDLNRTVKYWLHTAVKIWGQDTIVYFCFSVLQFTFLLLYLCFFSWSPL